MDKNINRIRSNQSLDQSRRETGMQAVVPGDQDLLREHQEVSLRLKERRRNFLAKIWPDASQEAIARHEAKMLEQAGDAKCEAYRMYTEFQRQALKEAFDTYLNQGKVKLRKDQTEFFEFHCRDLQRKILESTREHSEEMEQLFKEVENSDLRPMLRRRMERMIEQRIEEYDDSVALLMRKFKSIPEEGV